MANIPHEQVQQHVIYNVEQEQQVKILYTNWRGEKGYRTIVPDRIYFGSTDWHLDKQWLLRAFDVQKNEWRDFAVKGIAEWQPQSEMKSQ